MCIYAERYIYRFEKKKKCYKWHSGIIWIVVDKQRTQDNKKITKRKIIKRHKTNVIHYRERNIIARDHSLQEPVSCCSFIFSVNSFYFTCEIDWALGLGFCSFSFFAEF